MKVCLLGLDNLPVLAPEYAQCRIGGESVQQTLLGRALVRAGHDVSMVVSDLGQRDGARWDGIRVYKAYRSDAGVPVLRFVHPRWTGLWSALKRADADVYYTSCAGMEVGLLALFCRRFRRRFVFRAASDSDCDRSRVLVRYARDRWLYAQGIKRADVILVQSASQARALADSYGLASRVAGMFVEPPREPPKERDVDVLWVGNIRHVKRPDRLLALADGLPRLRFHMIGGPLPTERSLYTETERDAALLGNVVLHGRLPYADANAIYGRAKVLVSTSDIEGFPNAYLQAWIRGVPVVTFLDPDQVIESEGLGAAVHSLTDMRAAIEKLVEDPAAWSAASERCLAYMQREFGEAGILADYLEAFEGAPGGEPDSTRVSRPEKAHHV